MENEIDMTAVVEEVKNASEEDLTEVIKDWFEKTRTAGMRLGAKFISAAVAGAIQKHIIKKEKPSLRDYRRCMDDITKIISVQLRKEEIAESAKEEDAVEEKEITNE